MQNCRSKLKQVKTITQLSMYWAIFTTFAVSKSASRLTVEKQYRYHRGDDKAVTFLSIIMALETKLKTTRVYDVRLLVLGYKKFPLEYRYDNQEESLRRKVKKATKNIYR